VRRKSIVRAISCLLGAAALLVLGSCGSTNSGPSVGTFKTVTVTASVPTPLATVKAFSGGTCTNGVLSGTISITLTPLAVTLTSTPYTGLASGTAQPVTVTTYSAHFVPIDGGPAIPDISNAGVGALVPAGSSASVNLNLVDMKTITLLQAALPNPCAAATSQASFHYRADITFTGIELSGATENFTTFTDVAIESSI